MSARAWRSVDHPRHPAKTPGGRGGEFRGKGEGWLAGLSFQIATQKLRSDGTLLPPGPTQPDFDLIDEQSFGLLMDALREYMTMTARPEGGYSAAGWDPKEARRLQDEMRTLRDQVVANSADPAYARAVLRGQENALRVEINFDNYRQKAAPQYSLEMFKKLVTKKMRQEFASRAVAIRVHPSRLDRMLRRGRLTSLHETGRSSGSSDRDIRANYEGTVFGIPGDAPWQDRPIYGYLTNSPEDEVGLSQYGEVKLILKDEVRARTTAMFGDSLDNTLASPVPVNDPDWRGWEGTTGGAVDPRRESGLKRRRDTKEYIEAQIHGGVAVGDIEEVLFPEEPLQSTIDKLEKAGIRWGVDPELKSRFGSNDYGSYDGID